MLAGNQGESKSFPLIKMCLEQLSSLLPHCARVNGFVIINIIARRRLWGVTTAV